MQSLCFYNHKSSTPLLRLYNAARYFDHPGQIQRPSAVMQCSPLPRPAYLPIQKGFCGHGWKERGRSPQRTKAHHRPSPALSNTTSLSNFRKQPQTILRKYPKTPSAFRKSEVHSTSFSITGDPNAIEHFNNQSTTQRGIYDIFQEL